MKVLLLALLTLFTFAACDEDCKLPSPGPSKCDVTQQTIVCVTAEDFTVIGEPCANKCDEPLVPFCRPGVVWHCPCNGHICTPQLH